MLLFKIDFHKYSFISAIGLFSFRIYIRAFATNNPFDKRNFSFAVLLKIQAYHKNKWFALHEPFVK